MEFTDKIVLITGGARGIGAAVVRSFAREGAAITIVDYAIDEESEIVREIKDAGGNVLTVKADVSSFEAAQRAIAKTIEKFGRLDILVCNAGINRDGVVWKMAEEQWDTVINTNLKGCFNYLRCAAPIFREQKSGKIVTIASINGLRGKFGQSNYCASKAGIIGLTKSIARELGKYNVNVNCVAPGLIETEMTKDLPQKVKDAALKDILMARIGLPEDVANAVSFLSSSKARHITGEVIKVDGGQYL